MKKITLITSAIILIINSLLPNFSFAQYTKLFDLKDTTLGSYPNGSLVSDGTFLYGMTQYGGIHQGGTIFKIKPDGTGYIKLLDLNNTTGSNPIGSLIFLGNFLYGMTNVGGINDDGVIFKKKPDGTGYSKLLDFGGDSIGINPDGSLLSDGTFLYGVASGGTNNMGVIFKIKLDGTEFTKLFDFVNNLDGNYPIGSLITDGTFLYGMTYSGGNNSNGNIYKIRLDGTGFVNLMNFNGQNGFYPTGDLIYKNNFLYGMTEQGGASSYGVIFKVKPDGTEYSLLYKFTDQTNGKNPKGSLIADGNFLYGMTQYGGMGNSGVIFKINLDSTEYSKLFNFRSLQDAFGGQINGQWPRGSLLSDGTFFYGMTYSGGTNGDGAIFKFCIPITTTQSFNICAGNNIIVGNHIYNMSGTYNDTLSSINSCDSVVVTTINTFPQYVATYDTLQNTFTLAVDSLTTAFANSYHWDFGDGNTSTLTTPSHTFTVDTVYNVCLKIKTASNDSCSYCHIIGKDYLGNIYRTSGFTINVINPNLQTSVSSILSNENSFIVFPNPTNGETEIMFNHLMNNISIKVFNVTGQKILEKTGISGNRFNIDISNQTAGVYFIEILDNDNILRGKLIKE